MVKSDTLDKAKAIVAHGPNTAYVSRGSSQYVRDVMAELIKVVEHYLNNNVEPAAWRWNTTGDQAWRATIYRPLPTNLTTFDKIEPLYTAQPQAAPVMPKAMHWLGDREDADETRHAVDTTGCVLYFGSQGDCLEFMNSVLSALPRPERSHGIADSEQLGTEPLDQKP